MGEPPSDQSQPSNSSTLSSESRLPSDALLNTVPYGICQLDRDGYLVAVNDAITNLTEYNRDDLLGQHVSTFLDAEEVVHAEAAIRDQILNGNQELVHLSLPLSTMTDDTIPCEVCLTTITEDGMFRGTVGVVREVEDADAATEIQDAGKRRHAFDALAEASADGIILLDDDSVIRYVNPAVERILGYTPKELVDGSKMTIIPPRLREVHAEALQRYLETGEKHIDWTYVELSGQHKDGHEVPLAISINEFTLGDDHYFVGTFRDISKRKEVEKELEQQNQRLERFASMLAHELRNPLQVAQIYLDFIDGEDNKATIDQIANALKRIDEIIEVLLMLARGRDDISDREVVDLSEAVAEAWGNTDTGTAEVKGTTNQLLQVNRTHLQQLLENLFRNAIEHTKGEVTVRVGGLDDGFYVEDTGPGIPEDERERVVEAGYTTDDEGIGLGLTIVSQLADAYGWEYTITDSEEGGARFEFTGVETLNDEREGVR
ncbi:PAS domain S-box protein [Saliphagus sp. GCM10025334]